MRIERLEIFITDLPQRIRRRQSTGPYDTGPPGSPLGKPVLVKLFADGIIGYGQIRPVTPGHFVPDTVYSVLTAIRDIYGPALLGAHVLDIEAIWHRLDRLLPGNRCARAVLDVALYDAAARGLGVPVHRLLGGLCQELIPLEWSVSLAPDPQAMAAEACRAVFEFGIRTLCLKAGDPRGWRQDVANFEAVRRAVGDEVTIGIDANEAWTADVAVRVVRALQGVGLGYVEQPVPRNDLAGLAAVRREAQGIPVMADESLQSLHDAYTLAHTQAADVFCIKLYKLGGLSEARKVAAVAEAANIRLNVGGLALFSQLEAAAGAHFYASLPQRRVMPAAEFVFGVGALGPDPLVPETDFVVKDGHVGVPLSPGLGVNIDERALHRIALHREVVTPAG